MVTTEQALSAAWVRPHRLTVEEFERLGKAGILDEGARVELAVRQVTLGHGLEAHPVRRLYAIHHRYSPFP